MLTTKKLGDVNTFSLAINYHLFDSNHVTKRHASGNVANKKSSGNVATAMSLCKWKAGMNFEDGWLMNPSELA
jgi:hypothetical protein